MNLISVRDFMLQNNFVSVVREVRENANGYPFITFMDDNNVAENIYFSKTASTKVSAGNQIRKGFFNDFLATRVTNAEGEQRWKICVKGETLRLEIDELF